MPNGHAAASKVESRELKRLIQFPLQESIFPECSGEDDIALDESIREHGLREPIHVLPKNSAGYPENTILYGHRRRQSLLRLGMNKVDVIVQYDLADADAAAIEALFVDDNLARRQLSKLGKARAMLRLFEIERRRDPGALTVHEEREARDRVGKVIGMSGRNAQRYLNILKSPVAVQQAFESDLLTLTEAGRIASLPESEQQNIDEALKSGKDAKWIARRYLGRGRAKRRGAAVNRFIAGIQRASRELEGFDLKNASVCPKQDQMAMICQVNRYCVELIRSYNRMKQERQELMTQIEGRRRS